MATKREIVEDIRGQYGNVLSQEQVRKYLGKGKGETAAFLADVPFMREQAQRKKSYLAIDIGRKLYELQQTAV